MTCYVFFITTWHCNFRMQKVLEWSENLQGILKEGHMPVISLLPQSAVVYSRPYKSRLVTAIWNELQEASLFRSNDLAIIEINCKIEKFDIQTRWLQEKVQGWRNGLRARRVDAHHGSAFTGVFVYGCNGHVNKKFNQSLLLIPESLF